VLAPRVDVLPVVARRLDPAAEMEPAIEQRERAPVRQLVGIVLSHQFFNLLGEDR
jgi:hypothetical protein